MKFTLALLAALLLAPLTTVRAADGQRLNDFRRVVIADDALPVQRAAAEELEGYAGRIAGRKLDIVAAGKAAPDVAGLSFFVGDGAAERALGKSPASPMRMSSGLGES
ncbi:MAG: hypothetical protein SGI77_23675 [Pirellulaceae bacterium]|nr:hypothetical protein [Pirellulaceae bacterium]